MVLKVNLFVSRCSGMGGPVQHNGLPKQPARGNIAAVEPFKHIPMNGPINDPIIQKQEHQQVNKIPSGSYQTTVHQTDTITDAKMLKQLNNGGDFPTEFGPNKADPKYQTLPYNTKFTINVMPGKLAKIEHVDGQNWADAEAANNNLKSMTVHSTPLSMINKSLATPLNQNGNNQKPSVSINGDIRVPFTSIRGQPVGAPITTTSTTTINSLNNNHYQQQKPVSSVAPTNKPSTIYQTSSTKILPVQPQILQSSPQLTLSPPQSQSTPLGTLEIDNNKTPKPALPPKPAIKPPPRQTPQPSADDSKDSVEILDKPSPPIVSHPQSESVPIIKARPLTIKKQPLSEQPRLRSLGPKLNGYHVSINRRIEMPPAFLFPEMETPPADLIGNGENNEILSNGKAPLEDKKEDSKSSEDNPSNVNSGSQEEDETKEEEKIHDTVDSVVMRVKKGNLKQSGKANLSRRVSFDPLALLLDASLEGELELVKKTATQVSNPSAANDEGITALHNAICAGHLEIVKFLVEFGCDVNAQDSDGWTPLHCAASCNNVAMVRFLVEHGACIFATTLSDHETAAEKCEEDEEGFDGCSEYLYSKSHSGN